MPNLITQNPLLDELLKNGAIILSTHDTNYGVDYRAAFQAALSQGSAINYPTRSGKEVTVAISDGGNHIEVTDALAETNALFWASLTPDGVLQLGLYSRDDDGNTLHNDLFANDFFLSTANWFGLENIQAVDGAWSELSSNTRSVNNRIEEIILNGIQTEEVPLVDAIRHTFTAKMAAKLGFTEVIIINTTPDPNNPGKYLNMNVRFKRPSNPTSLNSDSLPYYSELKLMKAKI
ncbi:MAG TPA: hypothetical protein PK863_04750 [Candidatus Dojkabacteria bacterium]|nr:hypothetical protein [Candidatus Dojkabacteria bacterium]HRP51190.1 hypothetical protein [Candidatus Dojkabacteria bacterium]